MQLEFFNCEPEEIDNRGDVQPFSMHLGEKVCFSSEKLKASFDQLTPRQKDYISAYMRSGSPRQVAIDLSLVGSAKQVGKTIRQITKRMGLSKVADLGVRTTVRCTTSADLMQLIESQQYRCALSGVQLTPNTARLDHKVPVSGGGTNDLSNLQWVSREVNAAKGSMSQERFIAMCRKVTKWQG